jgi:hypothetical protein
MLPDRTSSLRCLVWRGVALGLCGSAATLAGSQQINQQSRFTVCQLNRIPDRSLWVAERRARNPHRIAMKSWAQARPHHRKRHHTPKHFHKPELSTVQPPPEAPLTPPEPPPQTAPLPPSPAVQPAPSAAGDDFNFELLSQRGQLPAPSLIASQDEKLTQKVQSRRRILQAHQALGFVTLVGLAATLVIGQLNYQDKYGSNGADTGRFYNAHLGLAGSTTAVFATTGILALAAPNPYRKPVKLDAALVHKLSMALATAGMVAEGVLGPITASREGKLDQRDWALAHLVTGYATFGFMATGVLAFVF